MWWSPYMLVLAVCLLLAAVSVISNKLTLSGGIAAFVLAFCIGMAWGWYGLSVLACFFFLAVVATKAAKQFGLNPQHSEKRDVYQVFANGGLAGLLAVLVLCLPAYKVWGFVAAAGAFSSATADTLSSEVGTVWGTRLINILSFRPDERGADGVISLEGTLAGMFGSAMIAMLAIMALRSIPAAIAIFVAGFIGNIMDSLLGAAFERQKLIGNNVVNFLNTLTGAAVAVLLCWLFVRHRG